MEGQSLSGFIKNNLNLCFEDLKKSYSGLELHKSRQINFQFCIFYSFNWPELIYWSVSTNY